MIDEEARQRSTVALAARKLVDFSGPHGWQYSATNVGRTSPLASKPVDGVAGNQRRVLPVVELRADFTLALSELQDIDRGAKDIDFASLDEAAHQIAVAENRAVFHGWDSVVKGISASSPHPSTKLGKAADAYPARVAGAVQLLLGGGVGGPYGLALGPDQYRLVIETAEHGGYPLFEHLAKIVGGPTVWAPGLDGAIVISLRGGDFVFDSGQDLSIGYDSHDSTQVRLYLQESFTFSVATPEAAVVLSP
jgi:uncharacterized linocin/CFP29 family protein